MKRLAALSLCAFIFACSGHPKVGDTRYCESTTTIFINGHVGIGVSSVPCGTYGPNDPEVQP